MMENFRVDGQKGLTVFLISKLPLSLVPVVQAHLDTAHLELEPEKPSQITWIRKKSYCLVGGNTELHCKEDQVKDQQEFLWSFLQLIYHTAPELEATRCRDQPE